MKQGYGKYVYARRKLVRDDADSFRATLEVILSDEVATLEAARLVASRALTESRKRHDALPKWRTILAGGETFTGIES